MADLPRRLAIRWSRWQGMLRGQPERTWRRGALGCPRSLTLCAEASSQNYGPASPRRGAQGHRRCPAVLRNTATPTELPSTTMIVKVDGSGTRSIASTFTIPLPPLKAATNTASPAPFIDGLPPIDLPRRHSQTVGWTQNLAADARHPSRPGSYPTQVTV